MIRWCISIACLILSTSALAQEEIDRGLGAADKGRAIAEAAERSNDGFGDTRTELTMTLVNAEGRERRRRLTWQTLEVIENNQGDQSLTLFHEPRDIEGTAFLSHTRIDRDDDQWLYLPALKRVKRIASANKSSAFVGSEFAYEDLLSAEVEKFDYRWLREETCGEWQCDVVEQRPRYANSGYSKQIVWIDQAEWRPVKTEFYDRKDRHLKTLWLEDYRQYLDRFWRAHSMRMDNHRTRKSTVLEFSEFTFQTGLSARDLDPSALRRLR